MPEAIRRSPLQLAGLDAVPRQAGVAFQELRFLALINLRVEPTSAAVAAVVDALELPLPLIPNTWTACDDRLIAWLGPDEWLIVGPDGAAEGTELALRAALDRDWGSVVDVSASLVAIEIAGDHARDLLARGCSLDLDPRVFTVGSCAQSLCAHVPVTLVLRDAAPTFWLLARSSMAGYLAAWLVDAAAEFDRLPEESAVAARPLSGASSGLGS